MPVENNCEIQTSENTVFLWGMRRLFHACRCEFLTMATEGVVHGVHMVVIRLSFSVTRPHKVSVGIGIFDTVFIRRLPKVT